MSSSLAVTTSMWRTFLAPKGPRTAWSLWGNGPFLVKYLLPHTFTPVLTTTGLKSQKIVQKQDQSRLTARGWFTKYLSPDAGLPNALGRNAFGCILVTRVEMGVVGYLSRLQHFWPVIWVNQGLWQAEWTIGAVRLTPQNVEVPQAVRMARWRPARRPRKPQMGHRVAQSDWPSRQQMAPRRADWCLATPRLGPVPPLSAVECVHTEQALAKHMYLP